MRRGLRVLLELPCAGRAPAGLRCWSTYCADGPRRARNVCGGVHPRHRGVHHHRPGYTATRCWCPHHRHDHARVDGLTFLFRVPVTERLKLFDRFTVHLRLNGRWQALSDDRVVVTWAYPWVWIRAVWG